VLVMPSFALLALSLVSSAWSPTITAGRPAPGLQVAGHPGPRDALRVSAEAARLQASGDLPGAREA